MISASDFRSKINHFFRSMYFSDNPTVPQKIAKTILITFVPIYKALRKTHTWTRNFNKEELSSPVFSIGNISVGGTGKTSFAIRMIESMIDLKYKPAVLKRGEGREEGIVSSDSSLEVSTVAERYGDEVALLHYHYPDIPIGVSTNRIAMGKRIEDERDIDALLLDDGFQYTCLERDLDVVLLGHSKEHQQWLLPAGPLRDHPRALSKADIVSVNLEDSKMNSKSNDSLAYHLTTETKRLEHWYQFDGLYRRGTDVTDDYLKNNFSLVTTLARPSKVDRLLKSEGFTNFRHYAYPDHHELSWREIEADTESDRIVMTEKEFVKFPPDIRKKITVLKSDFMIEDFSLLIDEIKRVMESLKRSNTK